MKCAHAALLLLILAVGCIDSTPTETTAPRLVDFSAAANLADSADWVPTPAGWYHRSCVHEIPDGAVVDKDRIVTLENGTRYQIPRCRYRMWPGELGVEVIGSTPIRGHAYPSALNGWVESAAATAAQGSRFRKMTANWNVPANPTGSYSNGQVYYTFPGLKNGTFIIQPVLQYNVGNSPSWTLASWHCDSGNNCVHSSNLTGIAPGDQLFGSITTSNCSSGNCTWAISTKKVSTGSSTTLSIVDSDNYIYAVGGAVEVKGNVTSCAQFPYNGVFYTNIALYDQNMSQVSVSWTPQDYSATPNCGYNVTVPSSSTVNLYHYPAPPSLSSISTNPSPPKQYNPFTLTLNGSGFDPATVEMVYWQRCYPPGSWCSSVWSNSQFSTKTSTQLVTTMTFGIADTVRVQLRNSPYGALSSSQIFVVVPMY